MSPRSRPVTVPAASQPRRLLLAGPCLLPSGRVEARTLHCAHGRIVRSSRGLDPGADLVATGLLAPGFIDLQVNGGWGHDFTSDPSSIAAVAERLPATGVTAFLPTLISSPLERYPEMLARARSTLGPGAGRATALGLHLEGPFLNPERRGAHAATAIQAIDPATIAHWCACPEIRLVTLAPELPNAHEAIQHLVRAGIVVSAGHSLATYDQAMAAFQAGVTFGTHLFNAMSALQQREPGLPGALLAADGVGCGLIADGLHVHPALMRLVARLKAGRGLVLVSDANAALGLPHGKATLAGREITVDAGGARLADGTLAGATVALDQAVRNVVRFADCAPAAALALASAAPAHVLGLRRKGRLTVGADADIVVLGHDLRVQQTIVAGRVAYAATQPAGQT